MRAFQILLVILPLALAREPLRAHVRLEGPENVKGSVTFTQTKNGVLVDGQITGLTPGKHGFHVHSLGDLSNGCDSTGGHFNPHNLSHGAPDAHVRHVGDLGNVEAGETGEAKIHFVDNVISLGGEHCILGRAVVVHSGEDDLGLGKEKDSLTTGHAGSRIACGVIGIASPEIWWDGKSSTSSHTSFGYSLFTSGLAAILLALLF